MAKPHAKVDRSNRFESRAAFLAWLGRRAHLKKQSRTCNPVINPSREPLVRLANTLFAWRTVEYPGRYAIAAHILGISRATAERYMKGGAVPLPRKHLARLVAYLDGKIAELQALRADFAAILARPK